MGADQQFCLRWNNFHTNITSAFESLRDDEDFVDITLACEGRQIKAHKMVLSACSPYFRSLLRGNPCQHPIVFLKDVSFAHLTSILNFMYHGEVNVSHNELATFLKTAEALRVRGLAEDEKKRDGDTCTESSSPPPPRDPPEPCSPGRTEEPPGEGGGGRVSAGGGGGGDDNTSSEGPPIKRQRRRSGNISSHTDHDTNTSDHLMQQTDTSNTTIRESVKNEPEDYVNEDDDMLGHQQQLANEDIKMDGYTATTSEDSVSEYMGGSDSVSISSRSQAAMQQLQDTFSTFIPGMTGQNPASFLPHSNPGGTDHGRPHPPFSLEGVQGLPPGISALPGPSMSQGGASQDTSGQGLHPLCPPDADWTLGSGAVHEGGVDGRPPCRAPVSCLQCGRVCSNKYILRTHMDDKHSNLQQQHVCPHCSREYASRNSLHSHISRYHRDRESERVPLPNVDLLSMDGRGDPPNHVLPNASSQPSSSYSANTSRSQSLTSQIVNSNTHNISFEMTHGAHTTYTQPDVPYQASTMPCISSNTSATENHI